MAFYRQLYSTRIPLFVNEGFWALTITNDFMYSVVKYSIQKHNLDSMFKKNLMLQEIETED